ncbi:MAG TPA: 16S rRNA (adenine(1518)-N(6)/adenine(1519)-N(6))-dimethyltransferase RsmA [Bacteroidota bacterium]|nr:16S rRNA (adenine(1518)-N(6)/adenine(1519)-N(6))-dimethyltransferase RsmA [Bacteroidota bacterium]
MIAPVERRTPPYMVSSPLRLRPRKSLGQNFLRDDGVARRIVASIDPRADDALLEIGPGEGALTRHLAQVTRRLSVVEIDARAAAGLRGMFPGGTVEVIEGDFLALDLDAFALARGGRLRIAGNIPYNITTPILFHVLDHRSRVADLTILVQKEVGRRMAAEPGSPDYGILSVVCRYTSDVKALLEVPPGAFFPRPRVTSLLMRLVIRDAPLVAADDEGFFRTVVRATFGKRRKTMRNSLRYVEALKGAPLPDLPELDRRPEELSVGELVVLSNTLGRAAAGRSGGTPR